MKDMKSIKDKLAEGIQNISKKGKDYWKQKY